MKSTYYANAILTEKRGTAFNWPATVHYALLKCMKGTRSSLNSQAVALNDTLCLIPNGGTRMVLYKVTTAGTLAAAQSTLYPGVAGEAITDGTATVTEQTAAVQAGTVSEPTIGSNAYARLALVANTTNWAAAASGAILNAGAAWVWAQATPAAWTTGTEAIWAVAEYDAASAGNLLNVYGLTSAIQVSALATPSVAAGQLSATEV